MEILLTGYTAFLTQEWIETAFPDDHVLTTHTKSEALLDTRVKTVTLDGKQLLAQINETYQFDRIVYFSEYLLPHGEQEGELDRLRWVLQACREREVQLLYFSGPVAALTPPSGKSLLANAAEELCFHYAKTSKIQVKVFPAASSSTPSQRAARSSLPACLSRCLPARCRWMSRRPSPCLPSAWRNWPT